ncbi:rhomboid family intramembrane serine protease [Egicoccus sp. AB-alg2]|uniref:rhomboid family intramembrane serine protease n=1 Tax=Egicoccus sp. AB-alg2 TaxID=3242693 RepID=UPI00359E1DBD
MIAPAVAVLPIGDVNPTRRRAVVTWTFIAINIAVFAYQATLAGCEQFRFVYRWAAIPQELLTGRALSDPELQAVLGECAAGGVDKSVLVSAITAMFLHGSLGHLVGNLLFLGIFGNNVEDRLGRRRFVGFYLAGGLAATAGHVFFNAAGVAALTPLVGASGAIAAILGAYLVMFPRARVFTIVPFPLYLLALVLPKVRIRTWLLFFAIVAMPAWLLLAGWLALQYVAVRSPVTDAVAYEAHIAGFLVGLVLVLLLDRGRQRRGQEPFHPVRRRDTPPPPPPPPPNWR